MFPDRQIPVETEWSNPPEIEGKSLSTSYQVGYML